jgi:hypothetical protein
MLHCTQHMLHCTAAHPGMAWRRPLPDELLLPVVLRRGQGAALHCTALHCTALHCTAHHIIMVTFLDLGHDEHVVPVLPVQHQLLTAPSLGRGLQLTALYCALPAVHSTCCTLHSTCCTALQLTLEWPGGRPLPDELPVVLRRAQGAALHCTALHCTVRGNTPY